MGKCSMNSTSTTEIRHLKARDGTVAFLILHFNAYLARSGQQLAHVVALTVHLDTARGVDRNHHLREGVAPVPDDRRVRGDGGRRGRCHCGRCGGGGCDIV